MGGGGGGRWCGCEAPVPTPTRSTHRSPHPPPPQPRRRVKVVILAVLRPKVGHGDLGEDEAAKDEVGRRAALDVDGDQAVGRAQGGGDAAHRTAPQDTQLGRLPRVLAGDEVGKGDALAGAEGHSAVARDVDA